MKPDQTENLIRNKVTELDHVPPPGVSWDQQLTWNRIQPNLQPRQEKKAAWWLYAAASLSLVLLGWLGVLYFRQAEPEVASVSVPPANAIPPADTPELEKVASIAPAVVSGTPREDIQQTVITSASYKPEPRHFVTRSTGQRETVGAGKNANRVSLRPNLTDPLPAGAVGEDAGPPEVARQTHLDAKPTPNATAGDEAVAKAQPEPIRITVVLRSRPETGNTEETAQNGQNASNKRKIRFRVLSPGIKGPEEEAPEQYLSSEPRLSATINLK